MSTSHDRDLTQYSPNTFPAVSQYVGSRLEDLRVSLVRIARYHYQSLRLIDNLDEHWMLSFIREGQVELTCEGGVWKAEAGDMMVLPPNMPRSEIANQCGLHEYVELDATLGGKTDILRFFPVGPVVKMVSPDDYIAQFEELYRAWYLRDTEFWGLRTLSLTTGILESVLASWRHAGSPMRPASMLIQSNRIAALVEYMSRNLTAEISRSDLSDRVCLHPVYMDRVFRRAYGRSSMQMLRELRVHRARELLETGDLPLSAVANECGLGTATYLIRVFRHFYGVTPNEYRKSLESAINSIRLTPG